MHVTSNGLFIKTGNINGIQEGLQGIVEKFNSEKAKGNSYAVLKLTDLTSVFELFIFSDILELNREILKEGNSLILTLVKSISNDENRYRRVNVQKIGSLKDLFNSPIKEVFFE